MTNLVSGTPKTENESIRAERAVRSLRTALLNLAQAARNKISSLTEAQRNNLVNGAVSEITGWQFNASAPTVNRENALFVMNAITLTILVYMFRKDSLGKE